MIYPGYISKKEFPRLPNYLILYRRKRGKCPENGEFSQDISKTCNTASVFEKEFSSSLKMPPQQG
jgi:hypothetical protein